MAEYRYLPLTEGIALTTVYALTCYTVIIVKFSRLLFIYRLILMYYVLA